MVERHNTSCELEHHGSVNSDAAFYAVFYLPTTDHGHTLYISSASRVQPHQFRQCTVEILSIAIRELGEADCIRRLSSEKVHEHEIPWHDLNRKTMSHGKTGRSHVPLPVL
jgi:hypothetical protein